MKTSMKYKFQEMLTIAEEIMSGVPSEDECTDIENEMFAEVQNIKEILQDNMDVFDVTK